ncbi:MAG: pseudouridine synthase [Cyanobacteriota bacterium]|nr:pseudouridine synthase [Cyanobacteriota bacterium]
MDERLQKIIATWGIASRRQAEEMILAKRVRVNGNVAHLGQKANPSYDCIEVDGKPIKPSHRPDPTYLLLNKPTGVVSTCANQGGQKSVLDLLPRRLRVGQGVHPVGRLDVDSTGALLLTNDGELTFRLTHPRHHVSKTYQVWVIGHPPESVLQAWRQGVILEGRKTLPARVKRLQQKMGDWAKPSALPRNHTLLEVILFEGRNRQIRKVAEQLGHPVVKLHRVAIGSIPLNSPGKPELALGHYRRLTPSEIKSLQIQVNL